MRMLRLLFVVFPFVCLADWVQCPPADNFRVVDASMIRPRRTAAKKVKLLSSGSQALANVQQPMMSLLQTESEARLREVARGLDYDWRRCFGFVHDNIAYAVYPGIMRGAVRTLMDREGNDADQAILLMTLLRLSGHSSATVVYEEVKVEDNAVVGGYFLPYEQDDKYDAIHWLGIPEDQDGDVKINAVHSALSVGHRWNSKLLNGSDAHSAAGIITDHFWVQVTIDGETIDLDPSVKPMVRATVPDMLATMRYSQEEFISSAGGTMDSASVRNLDESGIAQKLSSYVSNLRRSVTERNQSASEFLGERGILRHQGTEYFRGTVFSGAPVDIFARGAEYVNALRTPVTLTLNGNAFTRFYLDELGLRNLWVSFESNGSSMSALLHLDDDVIKSVAVSWSGKSSLSVLVDSPELTDIDHTYALTIGAANVYSIVVGQGGDAQGGMRKYATSRLAKLKDSGLPDDNPMMLAACTFAAGHDYLSQCVLETRVQNRVLNKREGCFYSIGISGQDGGPYVDMGNFLTYGSGDGGVFGSSTFFSSALEHSVLEQLNGTNRPAVSTIKTLVEANARGLPIYFATAKNVSTVMSSLQGYPSSELSELTEKISQGCILLAPQSAAMQMLEWRGSGYILHGPRAAGEYFSLMQISGGFNGGFSLTKFFAKVGNFFANLWNGWFGNGSVSPSVQADPIAMPAGAYLDAKTDLVLNRGMPLAWRRTYDSRGNYTDGAIGRGWSHGFEASIARIPDVDASYGRGSIEAVLPLVVASAIANDLVTEQRDVSEAENARRWTLAALAVNWWSEQMPLASASVKLGAQVLSFARCPDGTYAPAPGVTATLTEQGGKFLLEERHGNLYEFNEGGQLARIVDRSGNATRLSYDSGRLTKIENDYAASLTLTWNGNRIASVSDNTGRSVAYSYDASGCLTQATDARGKVWRASYDPKTHLLLSKTDPEGRTTIRNTYNEFQQITNQVSIAGETWRFGYAADAEAWDEDPFGNRLWQKYDADGRSLVRIERDGATTQRTYDGHGHVVRAVDPAGHASVFAYDGQDNLIRIGEGTGADYRETLLAYDAQNRLISTTDALGQTVKLAYDACHRVTRRELEDGSYSVNTWTDRGLLSEVRNYTPGGRCYSRTAYAYGAHGLATSKTVFGDGLPAAGYRVTMAYDDTGRLTTKTDANGHAATLEYDASGRILRATDALGRSVSRTYTDTGYLKTTRDALGRETSMASTASGKPTSVTYADGAVVRNTYDAVEAISSVTDARNMTTSFARDAMGRVLRVTTPAGTDAVGYDILGNLIAATNAAGVVTKTEYDSLSRPVAAINGLGATWRTSYDALDRVTSSENPLGKKVRYAYDRLGLRTSATRPSGACDRFGYDDFGLMSVYTNAEGAVYRIAHDALGRVTAITNAIGKQLFAGVYDGAGNLLRRTDGTGGVLSFAYDAADRLVSKTGSGLSSAFAYDAADNLTSADNGTVKETFAYDARNRLTSASTQVGGRTYSTGWTYDKNGAVTAISYASGKQVTRTYDASGRLATVQDWAGHVWSFTYDGSGKLLSMKTPGNVSATQGYDAAGRLSAWQIGSLAGREITYDAAGRRTVEEVTAGMFPTVRLRRQADNTYNAADQLVASQEVKDAGTVSGSYVYDGDGALVSAQATSQAPVALTYTAERQIASVTCGSAVQTFAYDGLGNRIVAGGKHWIPDFTDPLKRPLIESDDSGNVIRYYIWVGGRLLGFVGADGKLTVAHGDDHGNVIALTDTNGSVLWQANFGPNGEDCGSTGTNPTPFAWLGGFGVQRLGIDSFLDPIYNTRHRLYAVNQHRFLSSDPMGLNGGLNLYVYGNGNPVAYIDPLGLCASGGLSSMDKLHMALDFAGFIPGVGAFADAANAVLYLAEGDIASAIMSGVSAVPGIGDAAAAAKMVKTADKISDAGQIVKTTSKVANNAGDATSGIKTVNNMAGGGSKSVADTVNQPDFLSVTAKKNTSALDVGNANKTPKNLFEPDPNNPFRLPQDTPKPDGSTVKLQNNTIETSPTPGLDAAKQYQKTIDYNQQYFNPTPRNLDYLF